MYLQQERQCRFLIRVEIIKEQIGRETYYHVGSREFELAEVKLLIDVIQSSKFITQTKSRELINKIKSNVSEHQAKQLQRQVYINDRVKAMNESTLDACERCKQAGKEALPRGLGGLQFYHPRGVGVGKDCLFLQ